VKWRKLKVAEAACARSGRYDEEAAAAAEDIEGNEENT
jgi:hypothetical protein